MLGETNTARKPRRQSSRQKNPRRWKSYNKKRSKSQSVNTKSNDLSVTSAASAFSKDVKGVSATNARTHQARVEARLPTPTEPFEETCFEHNPIPKGYVFVCKGDVYVTRNCTRRSKDCELTVYIVYDQSGKRRLGIHVPETIYQSVNHAAKLTAESRAAVVRAKDNRDLAIAKRLLETHFPAIPLDSLDLIVKHAFLKRSGRVGRTSKRTDERKAVLAVEAHIRHNHTRYEKLLRDGLSREDARDLVWDTVQQKKNEWAGTPKRVLQESTSDTEAISILESTPDLEDGSPMDLD